MSVAHVPVELRRIVRQRAQDRCEYCLVPESVSFATHEIDHIVAIKHGGESREENLGLSCALCNGFKGSDLTSIDPETGLVTTLFHPRRDSWVEHFRLSEGRIEGITATGRVTARLLHFNIPDRIEERRLLEAAGLLRM